MNTPELPSNLWEMLIRLDQKVGDGFLQLNEKLDRMEQRVDAHDARVRAIETELADRAELKNRFFRLEDKTRDIEDEVIDVKRTFRFGRNLLVASWAVFVVLVGAVVKMG